MALGTRGAGGLCATISAAPGENQRMPSKIAPWCAGVQGQPPGFRAAREGSVSRSRAGTGGLRAQHAGAAVIRRWAASAWRTSPPAGVRPAGAFQTAERPGRDRLQVALMEFVEHHAATWASWGSQSRRRVSTPSVKAQAGAWPATSSSGPGSQQLRRRVHCVRRRRSSGARQRGFRTELRQVKAEKGRGDAWFRHRPGLAPAW